MKKSTFILLVIWLAYPGLTQAQVGGNIGSPQSGAKARAEQWNRTRRMLTDSEKPPTATTTFIEADVLMNVKADEYVAVFGLAQEGDTVAECSKKMEAVAKEFTDALKALGIAEKDLYLDFVSQTRSYGFEITGDIAKERLVGFELKKNLSIHFKDRDVIDKLTVVAARSKIFDLIKVDYVVSDIELVQDKLMDEAAKVVKRKTGRYEKLLGIKLQAPAQVYAERYGAQYPTEMYDSYTAAESEQMTSAFDRRNYTIQWLRKGRMSVFNGLDGNGFDVVVNPVIIEPVVQFTLHLKVKYEVEQVKAR